MKLWEVLVRRQMMYINYFLHKERKTPSQSNACSFILNVLRPQFAQKFPQQARKPETKTHNIVNVWELSS